MSSKNSRPNLTGMLHSDQSSAYHHNEQTNKQNAPFLALGTRLPAGELTELLLLGSCFRGPLVAGSLGLDPAGDAVAGLLLGEAGAPGIFVELTTGVRLALAEAGEVLALELDVDAEVDLPEPLEMARLDLPTLGDALEELGRILATLGKDGPGASFLRFTPC